MSNKNINNNIIYGEPLDEVNESFLDTPSFDDLAQFTEGDQQMEFPTNEPEDIPSDEELKDEEASTKAWKTESVKTPRKIKETSLEEIANEIKTDPNLKSKVEKYREDPEGNKEEKTSLPLFFFNEFEENYAKNENLKNTSFLSFDIDHVNDWSEIKRLKKELRKEPSVGLLFISPSANGLKAFIRKSGITDVDEYKRIYTKIFNYLESTLKTKLDHSTSDPSRRTFYSYDPDCYYNPDAEEFDMGKIEEKETVSESEASQDNIENENEEDIETDITEVSSDCKETAIKALHFINLPNKDNYDKWFKVLGALYQCGVDYKTALEWSKNQPGFEDEKSVKEQWDNLKKDKAPGLKKLLNYAKENLSKKESTIQIPPYPKDYLPNICKNMAEEISSTCNVPFEVIPAYMLPLIASIFHNKLFAKVKDDFIIKPVISSMVVQDSGDGKTTVLKELEKPLKNKISNENEKTKSQHRKYKRKKNKKEKLEKKLNNIINDSKEFQLEQDIDKLEKELEDFPIDPDYIETNITSAQIFQRLKATGGKLAIISSDARDQLNIISGQYTKNNPEISLYIKGYDGNGDFSWSRKTDTPENKTKIYDPSLFLLTGFQPDKLNEIFSKEEFHDSGFFPRIEFCYPNSLVGQTDSEGNLIYKCKLQSINKDIKTEYEKLIFSLWDNYGKNKNRYEYIELNSKAQQKYADIYNKVYAGLKDLPKYLQYVNKRIPEKVVKYALIFSLIEGKKEITEEEMDRGKKIVDYNYKHFEKLIVETNIAPFPQNTQKILKKIEDGTFDLKGFNSRIVRQFCNFKDKPSTIKELEDLERYNYLSKKKFGKHNKDEYVYNPAYFSKKTI